MKIVAGVGSLLRSFSLQFGHWAFDLPLAEEHGHPVVAGEAIFPASCSQLAQARIQHGGSAAGTPFTGRGWRRRWPMFSKLIRAGHGALGQSRRESR